MIVWFCVTGEMQKLIRESDDCVAPVVCAEEKKKRPALTMRAQKFSHFVCGEEFTGTQSPSLQDMSR